MRGSRSTPVVLDAGDHRRGARAESAGQLVGAAGDGGGVEGEQARWERLAGEAAAAYRGLAGHDLSEVAEGVRPADYALAELRLGGGDHGPDGDGGGGLALGRSA